MSRTPWFRTAFIALIIGSAVAMAACDDGSGGDGATVDVALNDFDLTVSPDSVAAGEVTFAATNAGPSTHEFEIFSGADEVDVTALPVEDDVADTEGLTLVDEIEDVTPGANAELPVTLEPGTYAIVCNLPAHYAQGMYTSLTVE
jgi:uncharacterized cupredoxin-like copper-binding protein